MRANSNKYNMNYTVCRAELGQSASDRGKYQVIHGMEHNQYIQGHNNGRGAARGRPLRPPAPPRGVCPTRPGHRAAGFGGPDRTRRLKERRTRETQMAALREEEEERRSRSPCSGRKCRRKEGAGVRAAGAKAAKRPSAPPAPLAAVAWSRRLCRSFHPARVVARHPRSAESA